MTDQTKNILKEMMRQAIDENGISEFLYIVSESLSKVDGASRPLKIFYHHHASEFFYNRAETLKDEDGKINS